MPAESPKRFNIWTPLTFSILITLGIFIGFQLHKYLGGKRPLEVVIDRNDRLEEIIDIINAKYVDSVSADSLYEDAVSGILKHLDPHTVYIPARDMASVTEDLEGNFKGIGVEFYILNDTIMITSVVKNGPSADAGILTGDKIIRVNDSVVAGIGITNEGIISMLRGNDGSEVNLGILRASDRQPLTIRVKRGIIPLYSVDASYMLAPSTGYIRINRFSATTYREFMRALNELLKKGMTQLVLDLRQNPGGYLDAATAIVDEFLDGEKLVVYTKGRTSDKEEYNAETEGKFETGRLIVMVDEGSASASEIIAGAVQDWDRGVVIGRRTYGKGLVQEQYELGDGSALRLTVARYYTPSGRSIQRTYAKGKEAYATDFINRYRDGSLIVNDTMLPADTMPYFTAKNHRTVYGGGGIKPDIDSPYPSFFYSPELNKLISSNILNNTVYSYFSEHSAEMMNFKSFSQFDASFYNMGGLMDQLKKAYQKSMPEATAKVWKDQAALAYLRLQAKGILARMLFRSTGYYQEINKEDPMIMKSLNILNSDNYLRIMQGQVN